jgi:hypothetical protein
MNEWKARLDEKLSEYYSFKNAPRFSENNTIFDTPLVVTTTSGKREEVAFLLDVDQGGFDLFIDKRKTPKKCKYIYHIQIGVLKASTEKCKTKLEILTGKIKNGRFVNNNKEHRGFDIAYDVAVFELYRKK